MYGSLLSILFAVIAILSFHENTTTLTIAGSLGYLWLIFMGVSSFFNLEKIPYYEFFSFYTLFTLNYGVGVIAIYEILKHQSILDLGFNARVSVHITIEKIKKILKETQQTPARVRIWGIGFIASASIHVTIEKIKKLLKETQQTKLTPEKIKSIHRNVEALYEELKNKYDHRKMSTLGVRDAFQEKKLDEKNDQLERETQIIRASTSGYNLLNQVSDLLTTAESIYLKKLDKYIELKERNGIIEVKEASKTIGVDERYIKSFFYNSRRKQNLQGFFLCNETFVVESIFIRKIKMMGKVDFEEIRSNLNITTIETKSIINRLYNSGKIKGAFTEDEKCFITENRLREIIRERL